MLEPAMVQLTEDVPVFVQYWAGGTVATGTGGKATHFLKVPSIMDKYLCVDCQWFGQYVPNKLEAVWYCCIATLEIGNETEWPGKPRIELRV